MHQADDGPSFAFAANNSKFSSDRRWATDHWPVNVKSTLADSPARTVTERSCVPNVAVHTESM